MASLWHPRPDNAGNPVKIQTPSAASSLAAWADPAAIACVLPDGQMPAELNGVAFSAWQPPSHAAWMEPALEAPPFQCPKGLRPAAGAVVQEADGRVWLAMPTNQFGGLPYVFPKGRLEEGGSLAVTALREVWEEIGLRVHLIAHLIDVKRSTTYTRMFLADRVGGHPGTMGWESQAAALCPVDQLHMVLESPHDMSIISALEQMSSKRRAVAHENLLAPFKFIVDESAHSSEPIRTAQASHLALSIRELGSAVRQMGLTSSDHERVGAMPEYRRLISGAYGCGWVCTDFAPAGVGWTWL